MRDIVKGVLAFQRNSFNEHQTLFAELAQHQQPEVMFFTCSDSRINPHLITSAAPGELFICRNAGNIVPPQSFTGDGMVASLEFGVVALNIKHIIVCGHTDCGAMKGAMQMVSTKGMPQVDKWLELARPAVTESQQRWQQATDTNQLTVQEKLLQVTEQNVQLQLRHLMTHDCVAGRVKSGQLSLHGWLYHIADGEITAFNETTDTFIPLRQQYKDLL